MRIGGVVNTTIHIHIASMSVNKKVTSVRKWMNYTQSLSSKTNLARRAG